MVLNNIIITQCNSLYQLSTPQGIPIAQIYMPPDGAFMADAMTLKYLTKALGMRWGVPADGKKNGMGV
ncbi:hypothetical protein SDC9_52194 [bioreactor metagenome]|uniref:Uncharacterized protein n=1 Tax=bioreactor metagenome TaxID=1076179 RepID=A0A644WQD5_9ZZZZ